MVLAEAVRLALLVLPGNLVIPMRLVQPTLPVPQVTVSLRMLLSTLLVLALLVPPELSMRLVLMPFPLLLTPGGREAYPHRSMPQVCVPAGRWLQL